MRWPYAFFLICLLTFTPVLARAACVSPGGDESTTVYDFSAHALKLCIGTSWVTLSTSAGSVGSAGTVQFAGSPADTFNGDATNFFWDNTNKRLGIGTASPVNKLSVLTSGASGTDGLRIQNATDNHSLIVRPSMGSGNNNGIVQSGDTGIIYSGGTADTGAFVIAPWASAVSGLRIDAAGNVGVGTASPLSVANNTTLHLAGASAARVEFSAGGTRVASVYADANSMQVNAVTAMPIQLMTNGTERMRIESNGNVGIGTSTTPSNTLFSVVTTSSATGSVSVSGAASGGGSSVIYGGFFTTNSTGGVGAYGYNTATTGTNYGLIGQVTSNSGYGVFCNSPGFCGGTKGWSNTSDARLKTGVHNLKQADGLDAIMKLRPVRYRWKDIESNRGRGEQFGFIAQDVQKVLPELIAKSPDTIIKDEAGHSEKVTDVLAMGYAELTVPLVKAVQELKADNDNLRDLSKLQNEEIGDLREEIRALRESLH